MPGHIYQVSFQKSVILFGCVQIGKKRYCILALLINEMKRVERLIWMIKKAGQHFCSLERLER